MKASGGNHDVREYEDLLMEIEALMESTPDAIYTIDSTGKVIRFNSTLGQMLDIDTTNLAGSNLRKLTEQNLYPENVALMTLEQKKSITLTQELKNGKHVMISSYPLFSNGQLKFVVMKIRDITELNQMKDELEQIRKLSTNYYNELKILRKRLTSDDNVVIQSKAMKDIVDVACRVARFDTTVLINGESGTGKEVIAKMIHNESKRSEGPFIKINCGAIPESLLESELFGYAEGSFTGAGKGGKPGLFELANEGTLLLDEIGDMPTQLQVKLLRVLQDQEFYRIGATKPTKIDVRFIAATNKDLVAMVKANEFREDLFYRLNVVQIEIPPLRERREDIIPLIYSFIKKFNEKYGFSKDINSDAVGVLLNYRWPGNVRELENTVENMLVMSSGNTIDKSVVPKHIWDEEALEIEKIGKETLSKIVRDFEKRIIEEAIKKYGNPKEAAKVLGVHRTTLLRKCNK